MKPIPLAITAALAGAAVGFLLGRQTSAPAATSFEQAPARMPHREPVVATGSAPSDSPQATSGNRPATGAATTAAKPITAVELLSEMKKIDLSGGTGNLVRAMSELQDRVRVSDVAALATELYGPGGPALSAEHWEGPLVLEVLAEQDPQKAWQVATSIKDNKVRSNVVLELVMTLARQNPDRVLAMIDALPDAELRQPARMTAINSLAQIDPSRAFSLISKSHDPNARGLVDMVISRWAQKDPEAAKAGVASLNGLMGEQARNILVQSLAQKDPATAWNCAIQQSFAGGEDPRPSIIAQWARTDPRAALNAAMSIEHLTKRNQAVANAIDSWADSDFDNALAYATTVNDAGMRAEILSRLSRQERGAPEKMLAVVIESMPPGNAFAQTVGNIFRTWATRNPHDAAAAVSSLPPGRAMADASRMVASSWLNSGGKPQEVFNWARTLPEGDGKVNVYSEIFGQWTADDPQSAVQALSGMTGPARQAIIQTIVFNWSNRSPEEALRWANTSLTNADERNRAVETAIGRMAASSPEKAAAAVAALPQDQRRGAMESLVTSWASSDLTAAAAWLDKQPAGPDKDASLRRFARQMASDDPQSAMAWANNISDAKEKQRAMESVARQWMRADPTAARAWIANSPLTPKVREGLLK